MTSFVFQPKLSSADVLKDQCQTQTELFLDERDGAKDKTFKDFPVQHKCISSKRATNSVLQNCQQTNNKKYNNKVTR